MIKIDLKTVVSSLAGLNMFTGPEVTITLLGMSGMIEFPVNPPDIFVNASSDNKIVEIVGLGNICVPGKKGLKSVSLKSYFDRPEYIQFLEKSWKTEEPMNLSISGIDFEPMKVVINNLDKGTKAGEITDIYYTLDLIEWVDYGVKRVGDEAKKETPRDKSSKPKLTANQIVSAVQNIWSIAKGAGNPWQQLYNLNSKGISNFANKLVPGMNLKIPDNWVDPKRPAGKTINKTITTVITKQLEKVIK